MTFGSRIRPNNVYKDTVEIAEEFAHVINAELKALVEAGATFIQLDEPARGNVSGEEMARLFNLATEGVKAKLAFHICFGNRFGRARFKRSYSDYFPGVLEARTDQFVLEFASREMAEIEKWKEWHDGRELARASLTSSRSTPNRPRMSPSVCARSCATRPPRKSTSTPTVALAGAPETWPWANSRPWSPAPPSSARN